MRNKKAVFAGALMVPALALTGGIAYASTTGSPVTATRTAVTSTVTPNGQHAVGQARHDRCDWRCGDHRGAWRGHGDERHATQRPVTQLQATQHHATQHRSHRASVGYQGGGGYQGGWGHWGGHHGDHCDW
jgi:hypothetical protein